MWTKVKVHIKQNDLTIPHSEPMTAIFQPLESVEFKKSATVNPKLGL